MAAVMVVVRAAAAMAEAAAAEVEAEGGGVGAVAGAGAAAGGGGAGREGGAGGAAAAAAGEYDQRAAPTARRAGPSIKRRSRKRPASTAASAIGSTLFVVPTCIRNKSTRGVAGKSSVAYWSAGPARSSPTASDWRHGWIE